MENSIKTISLQQNRKFYLNFSKKRYVEEFPGGKVYCHETGCHSSCRCCLQRAGCGMRCRSLTNPSREPSSLKSVQSSG